MRFRHKTILHAIQQYVIRCCQYMRTYNFRCVLWYPRPDHMAYAFVESLKCLVTFAQCVLHR